MIVMNEISETKSQNITAYEELNAKYIQALKQIMLLKTATDEYIKLSEKVGSIYSTSALYTLIFYHYLKVSKLRDQIIQQENIFNSAEFDNYIETDYYKHLINLVEQEFHNCAKIKETVALQAQSNFSQEDWEKISNIEEPNEFQQPFVLKVTKLSKNIKSMYEAGKIPFSTNVNDQNLIKSEALKVSLLLACSSLIDKPEEWNLICANASKNVELIKQSLVCSKSEDMLKFIETLTPKADQLINSSMNN